MQRIPRRWVMGFVAWSRMVSGAQVLRSQRQGRQEGGGKEERSARIAAGEACCD